MKKNENELGVSPETGAALSAASPQPKTASGLSASIADAPARKARAIKFRYWGLANLNGRLGMHMVGGWSLGSFFLQYERFPGAILMQFTGLRDKHGKEIWEGDIMEILSSTFSESHMVGVRFTVEWIPGEWNFHAQNSAWSYKVIGNIYENPELRKPA